MTSSSPGPFVSLLTDFGTRDPWVAICKGVILAIVPNVRLLDITHEVDPFDVIEGALTLSDAVTPLPVGVHLAVVDPGVGTERRALGIRTVRGDTLVGPDNGLLIPAAEALGGIAEAVELRDPRFHGASVSRTFHGRDVFAPAAGHLAAGVALREFGPAVAPENLVRLELPRVQVLGRGLRTAPLLIDAFGNVALAGNARELKGAIGPLSPGDSLVLEWWSPGDEVQRRAAIWGETFGDAAAGDVLLYEDSLGRLAIAIAQDSAADELGMDRTTECHVMRAP